MERVAAKGSAGKIQSYGITAGNWLNECLSKVLGCDHINAVASRQAVLRLLAINTFLIAISVVVGLSISWREMGWAFREGRLMTWISFFQLGAVSYFSYLIYRSLDADNKAFFWKLMSLGFAFFACDDLLRIHENTDRLMHFLAGVKPNHITDHLDDLIIVIYGSLGAWWLMRFRSESVKFLKHWPYLLLAIACAILSEFFDILCGSKPILKTYYSDPESVQLVINILDIIEESFKIYAEVFFLGAFIAVFSYVRHERGVRELR